MSPIAFLKPRITGDDDPRLIEALKFKELERRDVIIITKENGSESAIIDSRMKYHRHKYETEGD